MSTKRKAESRSRAASRPRIMKSGDSQVDSERDSGFSGGTLLLSHVYTLIRKGKILIVAVLFLLVVSRCKLRVHEHNGHHRFGGFTPSSCAAGSKGLCFRAAALPARCGGGLLLQPVSHDHHEQRPPQTGTTLIHTSIP